MCKSEAIAIFSTSSHCNFFFSGIKGLDIAFHKTNRFCLGRMLRRKKSEERCSLGFVLNYSRVTLTNGQSSYSGLFIKATSLIQSRSTVNAEVQLEDAERQKYNYYK